MNRREFTTSLGAIAAAPALPAFAIAQNTTQIAAAHFANAKLIARAHNACSPQMLSRLLRLDNSTAHSLQSMLFEKGVVTHANGLAMATNPLNTNCIPIEALKPKNLARSVVDARAKSSRLREKATDILDSASGHPHSVPDDLHSDSDEQIDRCDEGKSDTP